MSNQNHYSGQKCSKSKYPTRIAIVDGRKFCLNKNSKFSTKSAVYIWVEEDGDIETNHGWFKVKGISRYFGFAKTFDMGILMKNRPFAHANDLLSNSISDNWVCYCIINLSEMEARCLEALLISQSNLKLSKLSATTLENNCLINKKRETKYEKVCHEYLNLKTQWK